jgi:hypothetical protein
MKGLILASLLGVFLLGPTSTSPSAPGQPPVSVQGVIGSGWLEKVACVACGVNIVVAGGATIGGLLVLAMVAPEPFVACAGFCYLGFLKT